MTLLRVLKFLVRCLAFEFIALVGAIGYVLLHNALPEMGRRLLAGLLIAIFLGLIFRRLVRVSKDPVGSVRWPSND